MRPPYPNQLAKFLMPFRFLLNSNQSTGRIAQWQSACLRSAVQASATASCCGRELFTYIYIAPAGHISIMLLRPVKQRAQCTAETTNKQKSLPLLAYEKKIAKFPFLCIFNSLHKKTTEKPKRLRTMFLRQSEEAQSFEDKFYIYKVIK